MEPFHFDYWMLSLVRWKLVLEPNYPSKITLWVRLLDIPLQFRAAPIFQSVGDAIGQPEEGVEILVALRYEKLYGFCKECLSLTHDQSRCPRLFQEETVSSTKREPVTDGTERANATSYKAVVANGTRQRDERGSGQQSRYQGFRGGDKGQGAMVRDPLSKEDIRDMVAAGLVCSLGASNNPRNGEGDQLRDSTKLMLDAFKSVPKSPAGDGSVLPVQGTGTSSKTRKALLFEDSGPDGPAAAQVNGIDMKEESKVAGESADSGEVLELSDENLHSQALHEANLMIEGVLLSDSELLVEEDENIEEWEQGEITDFMEEEELAAGVQELGDNIDMAVIQDGAEAQVDVEAQMNDEDEEAAKKKEAKTAKGSQSKKRVAQPFVSPRKKLLSKAASKVRDKGFQKPPLKPKKSA
ncbi:LOW QUALITY PROTEIN: hypothetical protein HID58_056741, partial [Brassica napus]